MIIQRWANEEVIQKLKTHRVVSVVGCRQSGKTTLLLNAPIPNIDFNSLDSNSTYKEAKADAAFFVRRKKSTDVMVIDEIQKVPELIGQIKFNVDRDPAKGQYIISGSSDYRKLPQANESLAGRAGFVRVRTFSEAELRGIKPGFLNTLFKNMLPLSLDFECDKRSVIEMAIRGGYPEVISFDSPEDRSSWFTDYVQNQVLYDIRDQWGVRKKNTVEQVLESAAIYSSRELSKANLASKFSVAWDTLNTYMSAIEAMYLIDTVSGWAKKDFDRPGIAPKIFMTDSGLMAHLLQTTSAEDVLYSPEKSQNEGGKLVETWVYNQLMSEINLHPTWKINYFRSRRHEIDFMVTNEKGLVVGIEVKAGESVSSDDFKHLHWMKDQLGSEKFIGIVLYSGDRIRSGGNGCYALPMSSLWSDTTRWELFDQH